MKSALEYYRVNMFGLWHISYAIQLWSNVIFDGFVRVLMLWWWIMEIHREIDYSSMGLDFVGSGGQGGTLIGPQKMWA